MKILLILIIFLTFNINGKCFECNQNKSSTKINNQKYDYNKISAITGIQVQTVYDCYENYDKGLFTKINNIHDSNGNLLKEEEVIEINDFLVKFYKGLIYLK